LSVRLYLRLDGGELQAGEFRSEAGTYSICCSSCGHTAPLPSTHVVQRGGVVVPIWSCEASGCPAVEYLILTEQV
jgi:hypothetical protein